MKQLCDFNITFLHFYITSFLFTVEQIKMVRKRIHFYFRNVQSEIGSITALAVTGSQSSSVRIAFAEITQTSHFLISSMIQLISMSKFTRYL